MQRLHFSNCRIYMKEHRPRISGVPPATMVHLLIFVVFQINADYTSEQTSRYNNVTTLYITPRNSNP